MAEGITLTEDQFEELQNVHQGMSERANSDDQESEDELEEQIGRCNMSARSRCSRQVQVPVRYHDLTSKQEVKELKPAFEPTALVYQAGECPGSVA